MLFVLQISVLSFQVLALVVFAVKQYLTSIVSTQKKKDKLLLVLIVASLIAALICRLIGGVMFPQYPLQESIWFGVVLVGAMALLVFGLPLLLKQPSKNYKRGLAHSLALGIGIFGGVGGFLLSMQAFGWAFFGVIYS